jgi:uncharacterized protein (DUF2147 family)
MTRTLGLARAAGVLTLVSVALCAHATDASRSEIVGNWLTQDKSGIIEMTEAADGTFEGRIVGGNQPTRLDPMNPDATLRAKSLKGRVIVRGLRPDGPHKWIGGTIYDPNNGRLYKCNAELEGADRLKLRGYIGFSLLGRTELWSRYLGTQMDLSPPH